MYSSIGNKHFFAKSCHRQTTDFLIDGRRSTTVGLTFNLNNGTKTHLIIVKLLENTFLGMTKVRAWPILTLAMPQVKTEQIQNLALF